MQDPSFESFISNFQSLISNFCICSVRMRCIFIQESRWHFLKTPVVLSTCLNCLPQVILELHLNKDASLFSFLAMSEKERGTALLSLFLLCLFVFFRRQLSSFFLKWASFSIWELACSEDAMAGKEQSLFHYVNCSPFWQKETHRGDKTIFFFFLNDSLYVAIPRDDKHLGSSPELYIFVLVSPWMGHHPSIHLGKWVWATYLYGSESPFTGYTFVYWLL